MEEEFDLSKRIYDSGFEYGRFINVTDVKEFIKRLKEKFFSQKKERMYSYQDIKIVIDKLVGGELSNG